MSGTRFPEWVLAALVFIVRLTSFVVRSTELEKGEALKTGLAGVISEWEQQEHGQRRRGAHSCAIRYDGGRIQLYGYDVHRLINALFESEEEILLFLWGSSMFKWLCLATFGFLMERAAKTNPSSSKVQRLLFSKLSQQRQRSRNKKMKNSEEMSICDPIFHNVEPASSK